MKPKTPSKVLRVFLIATVLVAVLATSALDTLDKSRSTAGQSCYEAMVNFHNAMMGYETARISYYYNQPTTCAQDCWAQSNPTQACIDACEQARLTSLGEADLNLFSASLVTCAPESPDQCAQARAMADSCYAQYNPGNYATTEEYLTVWPLLSACITASRIDACQ